ncbi:NAD-dependent succinate-semialdehyde dehydrogenase [Mycobacterium paraterrae]|uniref:NAD-dependent succinate-semialdehyde dehydrogenase n=1 Tax=Mycobacterium paraterrae TaxID=577492 RepID=A0ABY3VNU3_9MYCO|nr:NAD-dependent succinate-semialdehyde dehydrogenase [Mycobacterium paraterrae]UMB68329.1 NAD-dependent succinate-semialdehyde dehydrogenase [Mycobacterium paraterrae]
MSSYLVTNPATGEVVETYPEATDEQIERALVAAASAASSWGRATAPADRAALLRAVAELHRERRDDLARIINTEMGKPLPDALGEVDFSADIYDYYAEHGATLLADEPVDLGPDAQGSAVIKRAPLGPLLGIMPWNFPSYQIARFAGPNLMVGNTIVLKHAPQCPSSAAAIARIFDDAGFPAGCYVNVYATNEQVADMIGDPRIAGVSVTGSDRAGAAVAEIAGRNLKKVVLELGGSDPFIVLGADDIDAVVDAAVAARLDNVGQSCNAAKRFIVVEDLYDDFLERFTARVLAASGDLAPLSSVLAADRLEAQIRQAVDGGARLASAGERRGAFFPAGVLTGVTADSEAYRQELFGPVAMVFRVSGEDEAVAVANDTPYGLGSYIFTADREQAYRVADRIEAGMVYINGVMLDQAETPFGGVKRSGFGRELGRYGMDEFVNKKLVRSLI